VAVVAPSGGGDAELLAEGCRLLASWGLDVQLGPHALASHPDLGYLAGSDTDRALDLQQAWLDQRVDAVLCARGGYGAQRIADRLDWAAMAAVPPKIFAGFSDITALHEAFALRLGVATLHAPNIWGRGFIDFPAAQQGLRQALFDPDCPDARVLVCGSTAGAGGADGAGGGGADGAGGGGADGAGGGGADGAGGGGADGVGGGSADGVAGGGAGPGLVPGRATGVTAGGNLSLIAAGLGTPDGRHAQRFRGNASPLAAALSPGDGRPPAGRGGFAGCILLLEDVREECYRLDRMLTQLLRSGALDGVAGIALGTWTDCGEPDAVRRVMQDRLGGLGVPVAWGLGFGHVAPQPTVPLGVPAELDADTGTLTFLEPAVT
jgi:muramoyltetrapeptide carboxypeptidase